MIICKNCGKSGHYYKDCMNPHISCGIILYKKIDGDYKLLMVQRKDSYCYVDIIRGKYNLYDINYIKSLFSRLTNCEINKLKNYNNFDELWSELWYGTKNNTIYNITHEYKHSKNKYNKLKNGYYTNGIYVNLEILSSNMKFYNNPEWEFPKGRREKYETNKKCAISELIEETNIHYNDFTLIDNISPYYEDIVSENNTIYRNILYLGCCKEEKNIKLNANNIDQIYEVSNLGFFTQSEALNNIRDYNSTKRVIIDNIFTLLNDINSTIRN